MDELDSCFLQDGQMASGASCDPDPVGVVVEPVGVSDTDAEVDAWFPVANVKVTGTSDFNLSEPVNTHR